MFSSLLEGKESLQEMAVSQSADIEGYIKRVLLDDVFWERVDSSLKLVSPVAAAITQIEGDDAVLSDVRSVFANMRERICTALPTSPLLKAEEKSVIEFLEKCEQFCIKLIHSAAYMLDPKYVEQKILTGEEINSAYSVISSFCQHLQLHEGKVLGSLAKFFTKQGLWNGDGIWQSSKHISASTWWKGLCTSEALSPVAAIILQIPPTSAASERNWSLFGNTHTKVCNRLTNAQVEKLVAIRANLRLFEHDPHPSSTSTLVDSDSEGVNSDSD